ncbi:MAG TPA: hypothetical protein PKW82_09900, partial [Spirochaetales bacterium]|nr:hypothetical protein [Spirochaetales bacterium]
VEFVGEGFAKLILFGEHAVVHGRAAVAFALPGCSITARWTPGPGPLEARAPGGYGADVAKAFAVVAEALELDERGGLVEADGNIPPEAGFGSSGALCAALARAAGAARAASGKPASPDALWAAANAAERAFHGNPSGVDTGLALLGGFRRIEPRAAFPPTVETLERPGPVLVVAAAPRVASCKASVAAVGRAVKAGEARALAAVEALGDLADQAWLALRNGPWDAALAARIGELARRAQENLHGLDLSTQELDALIASGEAAGSTGGKLSGGGAGGAFWLAAKNRADAGRVADAVRAEAAKLGITLPFGPEVLRP